EFVGGTALNVGAWLHCTTVAVTCVRPPAVVVTSITFEPVAVALGVTVSVVVPVPPPDATPLTGFGAKPVAHEPGPPFGTVALKVKLRGGHAAGSLFCTVIVNVWPKAGGPWLVVGLAASAGAWP